MKLKVLMVINAVLSAVFGIAFVLVPGRVISLYDVQPNPPLEYVGQLFGSALIAFAILTWLARNAPDSAARRAIVLALLVSFAVGFVVSLIGQLGGVVNALGWSTVVIYLVFTLGYGYFQFVKRSDQQP